MSESAAPGYADVTSGRRSRMGTRRITRPSLISSTAIAGALRPRTQPATSIAEPGALAPGFGRSMVAPWSWPDAGMLRVTSRVSKRYMDHSTIECVRETRCELVAVPILDLKAGQLKAVDRGANPFREVRTGGREAQVSDNRDGRDRVVLA